MADLPHGIKNQILSLFSKNELNIRTMVYANVSYADYRRMDSLTGLGGTDIEIKSRTLSVYMLHTCANK